MTPEEVKHRVKAISLLEGDPEAQHSEEDALYVKIVEMVAAIPSDTSFTYFDLAELVDCARIALKVRSMKFERWRA